MLRYVVVVGNSRNSGDALAIRAIRHRLEDSDKLWRVTTSHPHFLAAYLHRERSAPGSVLLGDRGVVLGSIYPSTDDSDGEPSSAVRRLDCDDAELIVASHGRSLIREYWGHYVAAIHYPERNAAIVCRSPASSLSCFHVRTKTLSVFFSLLDDYRSLNLSRLSVNWEAITAQVAAGDYLSHETAIHDIHAVECGSALECTGEDCTEHIYWDPRSFLKTKSIAGFTQATRIFRKTIQHCVATHAQAHDRILVTVSGGLDSSIILAALANSSNRPWTLGVNYHSRGCGDERHYARSIARKVGCELIESFRNDFLDLRCFHDCNLTVRPVLNFSAPDMEVRNIALAREANASAIFNGELGDNLFGSRPGAGVLLEALRALGFGRRFMSAILDYAFLSKQSLWRSLALLYGEGRRVSANEHFNAWAEVERRHGAEAAHAATLASLQAREYHAALGHRFVHPWLTESRQMAPGSHMLLYGLIAATSTAHHSPFAAPNDLLELSPLLSQPLVEAALTIPSYLHCTDGRDRAIARAAFSDVIPGDIINRGLGKGGPDLWAKDVVQHNAAFLREFFLEGVLVERGLIDRNKVEAALAPSNVASSAIVGDLFAKLYIEAWLRKFQEDRRPQNGHADPFGSVTPRGLPI